MLTAVELEHYRRQLPMLGEDGQEKLKNECVFVAGAGGLGTAVCAYLAAAGVGCIRLADPDRIDISNLNRQIFYRGCDAGAAKATILQERLLALNPHIRVHAITAELDAGNANMHIGDASILLDALDNFTGRYVLNRSALRLGLPLIHGAVREFYGQVTTLIPHRTPCLSCIWERFPPVEPPPILGATCGVIGSIQATEAMKLLTGRGENLLNRMLLWDGLRMEAEIFPLLKNPECPDCGCRRRECNR